MYILALNKYFIILEYLENNYVFVLSLQSQGFNHLKYYRKLCHLNCVVIHGYFEWNTKNKLRLQYKIYGFNAHHNFSAFKDWQCHEIVCSQMTWHLNSKSHVSDLYRKVFFIINLWHREVCTVFVWKGMRLDHC